MSATTETAQLQAWYRDKFDVLAHAADRRAEIRARHICCALRPHVVITNIYCGMGTWTLDGDNVPVRYDDDSLGAVRVEDVFDVFDKRRCVAKVENITPEAEALLKELEELLSWWVETTGGNDVDIDVPDSPEVKS